MLTATEVLSALDNCYDEDGWYFITLSNPYVYLIDSRLNIFRNETGNWAIAAEVLGFNPRAGAVTVEIFYFGNCLINLEVYNGKPVNTYSILPINNDSFDLTVENEVLSPDAKSWTVRNSIVPISRNKQEYINAGIKLKEYEPNQIGIEEAARLAIVKYACPFRATDSELYKSIPDYIEKIMVIDEWYHKEFFQDNHLVDIDKLIGLLDSYGEAAKNVARKQEDEKRQRNIDEWNNNRPGSYETWQQLAEVISTGDTSFYQPILPPNSHWKNWPESGAL